MSEPRTIDFKIAAKSSIFRFADVAVREREFAIVKAGQVQQVEPKAFHVLLMLVRNPNRLITKEDLLDSVWGDAAVTENSLARNIALLRRLLGDDPREPRFIETVAGVGYRWLCPVEQSEESAGDVVARNGAELAAQSAGAVPAANAHNGAVDAGTAVMPIPAVHAGARLLARAAAAGVAVLTLLAAGYWYLSRPLPPPRITAYTQVTRDGRGKGLVATDGNRLYFTEGDPFSVLQVSVNGGEVAPLPIAVPEVRFTDPGVEVALRDISPDGSKALICTRNTDQSEKQWIVPLIGGAPRPLEDGAGGIFTPDGGSLIYASKENGDIVRIGIDGTGKKKLANVGPGVFYFSWSPDRKTVRFFKDSQIWEMSADGSGAHRLLPKWQGPEVQCCGQWTSDGNFFVFLAGNELNSIVAFQIWALDERHRLFGIQSPHPIQLTSGPGRWFQPVAGKDGKTIFSEDYDLRGELTRIDPRTGSLQPFLSGISAEFVSFSPDGNSVAYVTFPDGILWRANRDGSNRLQLTRLPQSQVFNPSWSPDSKQIAFGTQSKDARFSIHRVSAADGTPQWLIPEDNDDVGDPQWSADGKRVLFGRNSPHGSSSPKKNLGIVDLETRQVTTLDGSDGMWSPRWSSDGRYVLAFRAQPNQSRLLAIFDFTTGKWRTLPIVQDAEFPSFSHDSQFIYYLRYPHQQGVFRIPVKGGKAERVADLTSWDLTGFWGFWMSLDPTDAPLVLRDTGSDEIYALTLSEK